MASEATTPDFFKSQVLGHPSGLIVLFFTEMWERFSYYGMRVLLILFLTAPLTGINPGWGWNAENAGALYGTYAMLIYLTPIFGGIIADKFLGYRWAVVVGSIIMTLGHVFMAFDTPFFMYLGLASLVVGTGFFKPNMTSILSEMYKSFPEKKDGAYTIFYMGVNSGAFFGMLLCGYVASEKGWHYGFGLAGIFMLLGTLQFWLSKPLFGTLGEAPSKIKKADIAAKKAIENTENETDKKNPFTTIDFILIALTVVIGLAYSFNDPLSKIGGINILPDQILGFSGSMFFIVTALVAFILLLIIRVSRYSKVVRDRMLAVTCFAFFTMIFFMCFEQAASSLVIFARDSVDRSLSGTSLTIFNTMNTILTIVPLLIISYVLFLLAKQTFKKTPWAVIVLSVTFLFLWIISIWMLNNQFSQESSEIDPSWFSILNSFFIISLASTVSKLWDSKYNPPAAYKYGFGLMILAIGSGALAFGSYGIQGEIKVSMLWLVLAYLFHTLGELFISPVGLSYVSKLVPARMIGFMFGIWYLAIAIGNKLAASLGGEIENITNQYSLSTFFQIFTVVPFVAGILVILLNPMLKKLMHQIK